MTCTECKDTGRYVGLNSIEVCRACGGVEVPVRLTRWAIIDVVKNGAARYAGFFEVDASEPWFHGGPAFADIGKHGHVIRIITSKATMAFLGTFVRWATPEEIESRS